MHNVRALLLMVTACGITSFAAVYSASAQLHLEYRCTVSLSLRSELTSYVEATLSYINIFEASLACTGMMLPLMTLAWGTL